MSRASAIVAKARFRVCYRIIAIQGKKVDGPWRDYYGRGYTYKAACEEVESLAVSSRFSGGAEYQYKPIHERVLKIG